ncbi:hypothetical protein ACFP7A_08965 [Sporolactobacillus kofuensis]|uniref:Uncharacterized protein n=1 Tax=Sporolactobacillus kofuensis TaxID=269672 RepID=A0ABW1WHC8_9BACL|nr:hypothetical protein [Sporolactobacillus kofuensis]MCO7176146.1 hypothetical protein [Sporolactobacillus kofuensis]
MTELEQDKLLIIKSKIKAIADTASFFKIEKSDFEEWKKELPEMKNADREEWLEMTLQNVIEDLENLNNEIELTTASGSYQVLHLVTKQRG